ncbi:MAG: hypothetical protein QGH33_01105, partial [Pirellulaceae bacterium]|nr:hypothetical protein [Pirellulaceae bacterium]
MARLLLVSAALSFSVALSSPMGSAAEMRAFVGARIIPIEGKVIPHGVILISGKKILAVGTVGKIDIPKDAQQVDVDGRVIMPGLICTHSHIGGVGAADGSGPIQPGVRVSDSINIHDSGFRRAIAGGLTTLNIMPGSGHLSSGQTAYVKLRFSADGPRTIDDLFLRDSEGEPLGGLKMANGTNSMKGGNFPETRGKSAFLVRQQFILAREYHAKVTAAKGESADVGPNRDLGVYPCGFDQVSLDQFAEEPVTEKDPGPEVDEQGQGRDDPEFQFAVRV